jgi:hypothetical protein
MLLAAGSLSVLVSLRSGTHLCGLPHYCIATALASLGLGILFGAVALYGEVRGADGLAKSYGEEVLRRLKEPGTPNRPIGFQLPKIYIHCEEACCVSLVVAVLSLIVYAIIAS